MKNILVEKLAMVKATRSVKVVMLIATPACSITWRRQQQELEYW